MAVSRSGSMTMGRKGHGGGAVCGMTELFTTYTYGFLIGFLLKGLQMFAKEDGGYMS